jgi:hypothetical protein
VVRVMLIMYVRCTSDLGHTCKSLNCGYSFLFRVIRLTSQIIGMGVQVAPGHSPGHLRSGRKHLVLRDPRRTARS